MLLVHKTVIKTAENAPTPQKMLHLAWTLAASEFSSQALNVWNSGGLEPLKEMLETQAADGIRRDIETPAGAPEKSASWHGGDW